MAKLIVFDLEGTLTNDSHREHLRLAGEYDAYHSLMHLDKPNEDMKNVFKLQSKSKKIIILTGKERKHLRSASKWLINNGFIGNYQLFMRPDGDKRSSPKFKLDVLMEMRRNGEDVECVYEDRIDVVETLNRHGFNTVLVHKDIEMTEKLPTHAEQMFGKEKSIVENDTGKHYRYTYKGIKLDPARIVSIYKCSHPMQLPIIKKALCAGNRGHKDLLRDIDDIICSAQRWKEMLLEDSE